MEKIRGKSLKEWKYYSDKDKANIPIRTQKYIIVLEERIEQLILSGVVTRLPIGTEITIINKESFKEDAGTKKTITGHCDYLDKPVGYLCDDEGIFLIEDFVR